MRLSVAMAMGEVRMDRQSGQANCGRLGSLETLIAPVELERFHSEYLGRQPLHIAGRPGRFAGLLDWNGVERLLETHPVNENWLRVVRNGEDIAPGRYTREGGATDRIDGGALSLLLDSGATLILNRIDEFLPDLARLVDDIGDRLHARTQANLYATCRDDFGLRPHWDHHDIIVIQLAGRKNWSLYRPTRPDPVRGDANVEPGATLEPDRDQLLEDGDVLYLPRGWIHAPVPAGEASLHLTISIGRPTGASFLKWLARELRADAEIRAAIPSIDDPAAFAAWQERIGEIVRHKIAGPAAERFVAARDAKRGARPIVSFSDFGRVPASEWMASTSFRPACDHCFIAGTSEDGSVTVEAMGRSWCCSPAVAAAIEGLRSTRPLTLGELTGELDDKQTTELRQLLAMLVTIGLLSATNG